MSKQLQLHVKVNRDRAFDKRLKCDGFNKFVPPLYYHQHHMTSVTRFGKLINLLLVKFGNFGESFGKIKFW
jgi:hypothetical protein